METIPKTLIFISGFSLLLFGCKPAAKLAPQNTTLEYRAEWTVDRWVQYQTNLIAEEVMKIKDSERSPINARLEISDTLLSARKITRLQYDFATNAFRKLK